MNKNYRSQLKTIEIKAGLMNEHKSNIMSSDISSMQK